MKTYLLSLLLLFSTSSFVLADILIADINGNRPTASGTAAIYSTLQLAINAATPNDTILVIPSTNSYGNVTLSNKDNLTIIGAGFNNSAESGLKSIVGTITIYENSSDVKIQGLYGVTITLQNFSNGSLTNLNIENNHIVSLQNNNIPSISSVLIKQNIFEKSNTVQILELDAPTQSGIVIANNIFIGVVDTNDGYITLTGGAVMEHNLFLGVGTTGSIAFETLSNTEVRNSIFYGMSPQPRLNATNLTFFNNLTFGTTSNDLSDDNGSGTGTLSFGTNVLGDENQSNVNPDFVNIPSNLSLLTAWDYSYDANVQAAGVTDGATDNSALGIFGGSSPFKSSGTVVPIVKKLTLPSTVQEGTNTQADITVSGN